jgi:hypothetical protein
MLALSRWLSAPALIPDYGTYYGTIQARPAAYVRAPAVTQGKLIRASP